MKTNKTNWMDVLRKNVEDQRKKEIEARKGTKDFKEAMAEVSRALDSSGRFTPEEAKDIFDMLGNGTSMLVNPDDFANALRLTDGQEESFPKDDGCGCCCGCGNECEECECEGE